jgi:N-acetylneuraminic acid mutarotase
MYGQETLKWRELPALPDQEGFAGPFAGTHNDVLVVAGGANFPTKMPWEGGGKVWYDRVYLLESPSRNWREVGKLPRPLGYGLSISTADGVVLHGGSYANQHYQDCFRLRWQQGKLETAKIPSLPKPCANACGALLDNTIYVAGGLESPTATETLTTFWSLDLSDTTAQWQQLEPWPGPARMLATAVVQGGSFFLCSGADLKTGADGKAVREYLRDAYRYEPKRGWKRIADLPRAAVAAPTPAPAYGESTFFILGGDDGTLVDFKPPEKHPGFPKTILEYDIVSGRWRNVGEMPVGHVTTSIVGWQDRWIMPTGEVRPGKRSPSVWSLQLSK